MKTLVIYYSYSGHTRAIAHKLAVGESADIVEILDEHRPGMLKAFFVGYPASIFGKPWPIKPLKTDFAAYDKLIMLAPIWANNVPPAFNAALNALPKDKTVAVKLISASGKSNCRARLESVIASKGCKLEIIEDIKA